MKLIKEVPIPKRMGKSILKTIRKFQEGRSIWDCILIFCFIITGMGELFGQKFSPWWYLILIALIMYVIINELKPFSRDKENVVSEVERGDEKEST